MYCRSSDAGAPPRSTTLRSVAGTGASCEPPLGSESDHCFALAHHARIIKASSAESQKPDLEAAHYPPRQTVLSILKTPVVRASQNNSDLTYGAAPDIPDPLIGDSLRLRQVITNLVGNAIKFTPSKEYGGTGLGLPISKRLVNPMQGNMWVESGVSKGNKLEGAIPSHWYHCGGFIEYGSRLRHNVCSGIQHSQPVSAPSDIVFDILLAEDNMVNQKLAVKTPEKYGHTMDVSMPFAGGMDDHITSKCSPVCLSTQHKSNNPIIHGLRLIRVQISCRRMSHSSSSINQTQTPPRNRSGAPPQGSSQLESTTAAQHQSASTSVPSLSAELCQASKTKARHCEVDSLLETLLLHASCIPKTPQPELLHKCLDAVLPICNGKVVKVGGRLPSSDMREQLSKYVAAGVEPKRYEPFVRACNIALDCLRYITIDGLHEECNADIIFQRNDPKYLTQDHQLQRSFRKPDAVILPFEASKAAFPGDTDIMLWTEHSMQHAPMKPEKSLRWKDVLASVEFKPRSTYRMPSVPVNYSLSP
ncbi:hypothetical protein BJ138DRAFT_1240322, partial [Hygrophoropsis aurantiaca]